DDCVNTGVTFDFVPAGEVVVNGVFGYDAPLPTTRVTVVDGQLSEVIVPLSVIKGVTRHADGGTVPYPSVSLSSGGDSATYNASSSSDTGAFAFYGIPQGVYQLRAQDNDSGLWAVVEANLADASRVLQVDATLPPSGTVSGVLRNQAGQVVAG